MNQLGLSRLGTATFFGLQLVQRFGPELLAQLATTPIGEGNQVVELRSPIGLSGSEIVALQEERSGPLLEAGLVAPFLKLEAYGDAAPNWEPLPMVGDPAPQHQPAFSAESGVAQTGNTVGGDVGPIIDQLKTRWRNVETDTNHEDQQQVAMAVLEQLADLQADHPDRLDLLKYRVQLLAYPLGHWDDVRREMEPLRGVPGNAEMIARFEQGRSVQPFS